MEVPRVGVQRLDLPLDGPDEVGVLMAYMRDIVAGVEVAVSVVVEEPGFGS